MTTDAAWLRARPEETQLIDLVVAQLRLWSSVPIQEAAVRQQYAEKLTSLRAAIREDVVRELAGNAVDELEIHKVANRFSAAEQDADKMRGPASHGKAMAKLYEIIAAAHIAGYERAREEDVAVARRWAACYSNLEREHADEKSAASAFGTAAACANDIAQELSERKP